jgi:hypothetical protein
MVNAARASFTLRACLWRGRRAHPHATAPPSPNQSLAKHNRKPSQIIEKKQQRLKSIASFCRVFYNPNGRSKGPQRESLSGNSGVFVGRGFSHDMNATKSVRLQPLKYGFEVVSPCTRPQILIGCVPLLESAAND